MAINIDPPMILPMYSLAYANRFALELADSAHILTFWESSCIAITSELDGGTIIPIRQNSNLVSQYFRVVDIDDSRPSKRGAALIDSTELGISSESIGHVS